MKLTPKRKRSDSATAAIAAAQAAALPPLEPPAHVLVPAAARPFWDAIVLARPRDTWNPVDLASAANLARCQADIEVLQQQVDAAGFIVDGKINPACELLEKMSRRALALTRAIAVNTVATVGRSADIAKGAELERQARQDDGDDLIPRLRVV
ncbi:MAG: terminase [Giesbergeria sp.]|nr:terminase [Giesbergeria sp.]